MEVKHYGFCRASQTVIASRKLRGSSSLHIVLVLLVLWMHMATSASAAAPPLSPRSCPLDMKREELKFFCENLPLPPPGLNIGSGGPASQRPPTCCQLSMNYWLAQYLNASNGLFFLRKEEADNCIETFNKDLLPTYLPGGTCMPLNASLLALGPGPCQTFARLSDLTKLANFTKLDRICAGALTERCAACGLEIYNTVTGFSNGFPLPQCVTAVTIYMGSRLADTTRWLNLSTCVGTAVYAGTFARPPVSAPGGAPLGAPGAEAESDSSNPLPTIVGAVLGAVLLAVVVAIICLAIRLRKRRKKSNSEVYLKNGDDESSPPSRLLLSGHLENSQLQPYLFSELQAATNNFAERNRVGTGGSADVYKGVLSNGSTVAIKKLLKVSIAEREFLNEIAVVATVKHRNLATLIGYSESNLGFLLVFDYYPNGSMEDAIFMEDYPIRLTWGQCIDVVIGAARGIAHLHGHSAVHEDQKKVIHRDIKPSNILLDAEFQACVADFGVSRNLQMQQTHVTTKIMGTFGYVAPEYAGTGKLTEKSDVYSFGVTMLVVMSKKQPAGPDMSKMGTESLVEYAFSLARKEQLLLMISTDYEGQFTADEAERFLSIALLCVQPIPQARPTFDKVVLMLEGRDDVPPVPIPAARSASNMLPGLKRLIFGENGHTGLSSTFTTTTIESLDSTQTFDRKHTGGSAGSFDGPQREDNGCIV